MLLAVALLPILAALILMSGFKVSPGKALPVSLLLTIVSGLLFWKMCIPTVAVEIILGCIKSVDIILIIFGAVLLLNILKQSGAFRSISRTFTGISGDRRIQLVIIAWIFSNFLEGAAGFGAAPVMIAPLLAGLGFPVMTAPAVALVCNTMTVPFGAAGIPYLTLEKLTVPALEIQGIKTGVFCERMLSEFTSVSALAGMFTPFIAVTFMILVSERRRKLRSVAEFFPFALFSGLVYVIPWKLTAVLLGPELPSIISSAFALPAVLLMLKAGWLTPRYVWDFHEENPRNTEDIPLKPEQTVKSMPLWKAWLPYLLIAVFLLLTRVPFLPLKNFLSTAWVISTPALFGVQGISFQWAPLMNPGILPFAAAAAVSAFLYRIPFREFLTLMRGSGKQIQPSAAAIAASFAMVQIMILSAEFRSPGMLQVIAEAAAKNMGPVYPAVAPAVGAFGTFFSGSCTLSNLLFGAIQLNAAQASGFSASLILALQNAGGGLGSMIRLSGIVAACAAVNVRNQEGKLLLLNLLPLSAMLVLTILVSLLFL